MSNNFALDSTPQIAAVLAAVSIVDTVVDAIRATDVPDIQTNIDATETKVDLIRGTDVPNIQTNIDANETKLDTIIAAIPQNVRGTFATVYANNTTGSFADILNLASSHGKLYTVTLYNAGSVNPSEIRITVDGEVSQSLSVTNNVTLNCIYNKLSGSGSPALVLDFSTTTLIPLNLEFADSLQIECKVTGGSGQCQVRVNYFLDSF